MATTQPSSAEQIADIANAYIAEKGYENFVSNVSVSGGKLYISGMNMVVHDILKHLTALKIEFTATGPGIFNIADVSAKAQ